MGISGSEIEKSHWAKMGVGGNRVEGAMGKNGGHL